MAWGLLLYMRARNNASPQRRTFLTPTSEGNKKHLYGQGKPMAKDASGDGADFSTGEASVADDGGGGTVQVESRLFFDGTVAPTDMSRATDAREKGRIGILGSGLSYAGSYSRVTSETIGRDLNPLGRGDGNAYVGGQLNLGRITPRLPMSTAPGGWGNSVNNGCGDGGGCSAGISPFIMESPNPFLPTPIEQDHGLEQRIQEGIRNYGNPYTLPPRPPVFKFPPPREPKAVLPSGPPYRPGPPRANELIPGLDDFYEKEPKIPSDLVNQTGIVAYFRQSEIVQEQNAQEAAARRQQLAEKLNCCANIPVGLSCSHFPSELASECPIAHKYFKWPSPNQFCRMRVTGDVGTCIRYSAGCGVMCAVETLGASIAGELIGKFEALMSILLNTLSGLAFQDWKTLLRTWTIDRWIAILKEAGFEVKDLAVVFKLLFVALNLFEFAGCIGCCIGMAEKCTSIASSNYCTDSRGKEISWETCL